MESSDSYEVECEFIGTIDTPFEIFLDSINVLTKLLIINSTY